MLPPLGGFSVAVVNLVVVVRVGSAAGDGIDLGSQRPADLCRRRLWRVDGRRAEASRVAAAALWTSHPAPTRRRIQHLPAAAALQTAGCHHGAFHADHQGTRPLWTTRTRRFYLTSTFSVPSVEFSPGSPKIFPRNWSDMSTVWKIMISEDGDARAVWQLTWTSGGKLTAFKHPQGSWGQSRSRRKKEVLRWVSELEFNVPFQHKHGYIRDRKSLGILFLRAWVQRSSLLWTRALRSFYNRPIALAQEGRSLVNDVWECLHNWRVRYLSGTW